MPARQTKQVTQTGATSITASMDNAPIVNNLLVATVDSNDGTCTNPTGFTTAIEVYNATDDDFLRITYKVVAAGDSSDITFTGFVGNTKHLQVSEWPCNDVTTPLDQTASTGTTAAVSTISSGTTATMTVAKGVAIAQMAVRAAATAESVDNGYALFVTGDGTFSDASAYREYQAAAAAVTQFSWTTAGTAWSAIAVFRASGHINRTVPSMLRDNVLPLITGRDDGKWDHARSVDFWW
jgi:hypothetical protein